MSNINKQKVEGTGNTTAGRDINMFSYSESSPEMLGSLCEVLLTKKTEEVNTFLESGVYHPTSDKIVPFSAFVLFESLMELAIPFKIVIDIINNIPDKLKKIKDNNPSTNDIRKIVYKMLCSLDYSKYGKNIEIWGEHYIRKYGNPNERIRIIMDNENKIEYISYELLEKKLIPDVYYNCYQSDIHDDFKQINIKSYISDISRDVIEKVRLLNLNFIRYSTLLKLTYDLAIQPPHPWFTEPSMKEKHLDYNFQKMNHAYVQFQQCEESGYGYYGREFIEHSCAFILTFYSLFIGIGKLAPLRILIKYLELSLNEDEGGDDLLWNDLQINNLKGDLLSINNKYTIRILINRLKKINADINDTVTQYESLKSSFELIFDIVKNLNNINSYVQNVNSLEELIVTTIKLFSRYSNVIINTEKCDLKFIKEHKTILGTEIKDYIRLGFVFIDNSKTQINVSDKEKNRSFTNSIIIISNKALTSELYQEICKEIKEDFCYLVSLEELINNTKEKSREIKLINILKDRIKITCT